jgi:thioredoxin reductase/SAM-dependent methyltransferase
VAQLPGGQFRVELADGHAVVARRVLAATGLVDELPDIDGLAQHWGRDVIHCPFCHGYEVRDRRIVQVVTHPMGLHTAPLFRQLTSHLTVVVHGAVDVPSAELDAVRAGGVTVVDNVVQRVSAGADGRLETVHLADGSRLDADAVAITPRFRPRVEPFHALGLRPAAHPSGLGEVIETDATGETAVPGLYATGNVTDPSQQVAAAAASGGRVGGMIGLSLAQEDLQASARRSGTERDWDHRYGGDQIWSGNPNGTLVHEAGSLVPGRALDVGAGEGGDALWLAERGWDVTACDISRRALNRIDAEARRRRLAVRCLHADANGLDPFEAEAFDLVCAQYASIPRTPDRRAVHNLARAVAAGGTLLVVSHDLAAMRAAADGSDHRPLFDAAAYVRVDDIAAALGEAPGWTIEVLAKRPRPAGAASTHHVDDIVLRARRDETG